MSKYHKPDPPKLLIVDLPDCCYVCENSEQDCEGMLKCTVHPGLNVHGCITVDTLCEDKFKRESMRLR